MAGQVLRAGLDRHVDAMGVGREESGVAQVLSMMTQAPRACTTSAMAGMSWISKVCEPGDSTSTAFVFDRMRASIPAPMRGS